MTPIEATTSRAPTSTTALAASGTAPARTIWGLDPVQLHSRYWASFGVQVVRQGEPSEIVRHAELFLLTESPTLTVFKLSAVLDSLNWIKPEVLFIRLHDSRERGYRERVVTDDLDQFVKFERLYDASGRLTRVVLTPDRDVAKLWQSAPDPVAGWRRLRKFIPRTDRATVSVEGNVYDRTVSREVSLFIHDLVNVWRQPDSTVLRAMQHGSSLKPAMTSRHTRVWRDAQAKIDPTAKFIGPVWVGCGRKVEANTTVIGPAVIWDDPKQRPVNDEIRWQNIEPKPSPEEAPPPKVGSPLDRALKRGFDIAFSSFALLCSLPLYPFIMLAIWLEDGRPFFFAHIRETRGGRDFPCVKFRSMRKDAEKMKLILKQKNQADGPQFFMENDPRLTRTGKFLRKYNLDELPQFWNVLTGDMSIVGPRPSPHKENQYCPPWREARLSVRPGITGLWQVKRTRRAGSDFQEWIKYDLEYVEKHTFWLDLKIIWGTVANMLGKVSRS